MKLMIQFLYRECLIQMRQPMRLFLPLIFFLLILFLFPIALGGEPHLLERIGPGVVWVSVLLSVLLILAQLFRAELEEGILHQWIFSPLPLAFSWLLKVAIQWFFLVVPLVFISPLVCIWYGVSWETWERMILALGLGTPSLVLIGALLSTLTLGIRGADLLLALLVLPLYVPILIYGAGLAIAPSPVFPAILLGAILIFSAVLCPIFSSILLRRTLGAL